MQDFLVLGEVGVGRAVVHLGTSRGDLRNVVVAHDARVGLHRDPAGVDWHTQILSVNAHVNHIVVGVAFVRVLTRTIGSSSSSIVKLCGRQSTSPPMDKRVDTRCSPHAISHDDLPGNSSCAADFTLNGIFLRNLRLQMQERMENSP